MEISFRPTKEYIVEGEILVIDPHYLLDENVVKVIEDTYYDENSLLPSSGVIGKFPYRNLTQFHLSFSSC